MLLSLRPTNEDKLEAVSFLRILNLVAMIIEIIILIYMVSSYFGTGIALVFHTISLFSSAMYHVFPEIRHNKIFSFIAHTLSTLILGLCLLAAIWYINSEGVFERVTSFIVLTTLAGPAALVAITLLLLLNFDTVSECSNCGFQPRVQYVLVQPQPEMQCV